MALVTPEDSIDAWLQDTHHPAVPGWTQNMPVQSGQWDKKKAMNEISAVRGETGYEESMIFGGHLLIENAGAL